MKQVLLTLTTLLVLGFSAPNGPSKTRGSWGESWQNRGRMGQASACRPDHKIKAGPTVPKRWKFIELTDRNLVSENNSPTKWPSIVHSLTVQSKEAVRRISQFHISTGSMLKSNNQKRAVKRKSSRKGEKGSERLTKRLTNTKRYSPQNWSYLVMLWTWARQKNKPEVKKKKANLRE